LESESLRIQVESLQLQLRRVRFPQAVSPPQDEAPADKSSKSPKELEATVHATPLPEATSHVESSAHWEKKEAVDEQGVPAAGALTAERATLLARVETLEAALREKSGAADRLRKVNYSAAKCPSVLHALVLSYLVTVWSVARGALFQCTSAPCSEPAAPPLGAGCGKTAQGRSGSGPGGSGGGGSCCCCCCGGSRCACAAGSGGTRTR